MRRVPRGFWACFVIGVVNACVWAVITPTFQVPDEVVHVGYAQYLAESGKVPRPMDTRPGAFYVSQEENVALVGVPFSYQGVPSWSPAHDRAVRRTLDGKLDREHEPAAGAAANYPPLYYALEAVPYKLASGGSFFDRLLAMRLFSALFAGLTAGFCFLFVRELLPGTPWAWLAAGVAVAFQPLTAFVSGGVNPEALLYASSAALFYLLARALRRGLTPKLGAAIGAAIAVALFSKGTALAFLPPVALALGLLVRRTPRPGRRRALIATALAVVVAAVPFGGWLVASSVVYDRPGGTVGGGIAAAPEDNSLNEQVSYAWQLYLPRLPFMDERFRFFPPRTIWFDGFIGRLGYAQYAFPQWFNDVALVVAFVLLALAAVALFRRRDAIRGRWTEAVVYSAMIASTMAVVGIAVFRLTPREAEGVPVAQARYLLPLLAIYAAGLALAAKAPGRRFGPAVAAVIVVLAAGHNLAAILLSLERYYT
jgi:4-amino-4-deoxy-L-arabinose transferase-like glycosyltransferase